MRFFTKLFFISVACLMCVRAASAQTVFYSETFDSGFNGWAATPVGINGLYPNAWFVSCNENGMAPGQCGAGCVGAGNNTLHIASTAQQAAVNFFVALLCPTGDCGAAYFAGDGTTDYQTNTRAQSPVIDLSEALCPPQLSFNYIENGDGTTDNFILEFSDDGGASWIMLDDPAKTPTGACAPQGQWTAYSIALPASAVGNPNVRIGFRWVNDDDAFGTDPSVAIDSVFVTGSNPPVAAFTLPTALCGGAPLSLTLLTTDSVEAFADGVMFDVNDAASLSFFGPDTVDICIVALDACGSSDTLCLPLYVVDCTVPLQPVITASDTTICLGDCISFSSVGSTPGIDQFSWSFPGGTPVFSPAANPSSVCYDTEGTFDVQLTVYGLGAPFGDVVYSGYITVSNCTAGPNVDMSFSPSSPVCLGDSVSFIAICDSCVSFAWDFGPDATPSTSTDANPTVVYNTVGIYDVSLTGTDANGGTTTNTQAGIVNVGSCDSLEAYFIPSAVTVCQGDSLTFTDSSTNAVQWGWFFSGGTPDLYSGQNPPPIVFNAAPGPGFFAELTVTDIAGNSSVYTVMLDILDCSGPAAFTMSDDTICTNGCVTFTNTSTASAAATYGWFFDQGTPNFSLAADPPQVCYTTAGTYDVVLVVNDGGVIDSAVMSIVVESCPVPVAEFSASDTDVCTGDLVSFTDESQNATQWSWSFPGGSPASFNGQTPTDVTYSAAGDYVVTLVVTDAAGNTASSTLDIAVTDCGSPPTASFTPADTTICSGNAVAFTFTGSASASATYQWDFPGGNPLTSANASQTVTFASAGTYNVVLVVTDGIYTDTAEQTVTVNDCPVPVASFTASVTNPCRLDPVVFTDQSQNATSWSWTFQNGSPATWSDATPPSVTFNTAGAQTVTLVVADSLLTDTFTMTINVVACGAPTAAFASSDTLICPGECVQFFDLSDTAIGWLWSFPGGSPSASPQQNPPFVCYTEPGSYDVQLIAFNLLGADTILLQDFITVQVPPVAMSSVDSVDIIIGQSVSLAGSGGDEYAWIPALYLDRDSAQYVTATPPVSVTYTLVTTDDNGCTASDEAIITVRPPNSVFVPNLFTPNGDKVNDLLFTRTTGEIDKMEFAVYDRWGNMMFYTTDPFDHWDGTYNGRPMNAGVYVYFYRVRFTDGIWEKGKGDVTLVR